MSGHTIPYPGHRIYHMPRPRQASDALIKTYESMEDALGFTGTVDGYFPPQYASGVLSYPTLGTMSPIVPTAFADWEDGTFGAVNTNFAVDATETGNTLTCYAVIDRGSELWKRNVATLTKESEAPSANPSYYWRGFFADLDWKISNAATSESIVAISGSSFLIAGDHVSDYPSDIAAVNGSTGNDGEYTITGRTYNSEEDRTYIAVAETIPDATADGTLDQTTYFLFSVDEMDLADWSAFQLACLRDVDTGQWYRYDTELSGVKPYVDGYPLAIDPNKPGQILAEPMTGQYYSKGRYTVEPAAHRQRAVKIRYCHHTTGEIYAGEIALPNTGSSQTSLGGLTLQGIYHSDPEEDDEIVLRAACDGVNYWEQSWTSFDVLS